MLYKTYRLILFWISAAVFIISLAYVLTAAVRIFPAFGFIGVLSADEKLGLMKKTSVYILAGTACILLTAPEKRTFSCRTLILSVVSAGLMPSGILLFDIQPAYISSYQISAVCFYIIPFTMISAISDLVPSVKKIKSDVYIYVLLFLGLLIFLFVSLTGMYLITGSVLLMPLILFIMLPVSVIFNLIVFLNRFTMLFSLKTMTLFYLDAAVLPACGIFIPYNAEIAISAGGIIFIAGTVLSLIYTILDFRRVQHG